MRRERLLRLQGRIALLWVRLPSAACGSSSNGRARNETVSADVAAGICLQHDSRGVFFKVELICVSVPLRQDISGSAGNRADGNSDKSLGEVETVTPSEQ